MEDASLVKRNIRKMLDLGASESEVDIYVSSTGWDIESLRNAAEKPPSFSEKLLPGLARGATGLVGMPVDVVNTALSPFMKTSPTPYGGSENLLNLSEAVTGMAPGALRQGRGTLVGNIAEELGAAGIPVGGVAQSALKAAPYLQAQGASFAQAPKRYIAGEVAGAVGSGAGRTAAQDEETPGAELAGGVAGGVAGTLTARAPGVIQKSTRLGLSKGARLRTAAETIQRAVVNKDLAIKNIKESLENPYSMTLGEASKDVGLATMERSFIRSGPSTRQARKLELEGEQNEELMQELEGALSSRESGQRAKEFFTKDVEGEALKIESIVSDATTRAREKIARLGPAVTRSQASMIAREELKTARNLADDKVKELWSRVDKEEPVSTEPVKEAVATLLSEQLKASNPANLPARILRIIGLPERFKKGPEGDVMAAVEESLPALDRRGEPLGDIDTIGELQELRSEILAAKREADAGRNKRLSANLDRLQEAVLETLDQGQGGELRQALDATRIFKDKFTRGPIGRLLGKDRAGGERTPSGQTLEGMVSGPKGAEVYQRIKEAAPQAQLATEQYLRGRFAEAGIGSDGNLKIESARTFLRNYGEVLEDMPILKRDIADAIEAQERIAYLTKQKEFRTKSLATKSQAAKFLDQSPERAMRQVMDSADPVEAVKDLKKRARKDLTGQTIEGMRRAFWDSFKEDILLGKINTKGERALSALKLRKTTERYQSPLQELYTPEQLSRMEMAKEQANRLEAMANTGIGRGSDTVQNASGFMMLLSGYGGALLGGAIGTGPGSLRTTNILSSFARKIVGDAGIVATEQLIEDAIFDPRLGKVLLEKNFADLSTGDMQYIRGYLYNINQDLKLLREPEEGKRAPTSYGPYTPPPPPVPGRALPGRNDAMFVRG